MTCPNCNHPSTKEAGLYPHNANTHTTFSKLSLHACNACGLSFAHPMPGEEALNKYYQTYWKGEVATVSEATTQYYLAQSINRVRFIGKHFELKKGLKVLDIGAGPGLFLQALLKEQYSVEYSAIEPDLIQSSMLSQQPSVNCVYPSINDITTTEKFDLIILSHVLEHVSKPKVFLSQIFTLLEKSGHLYVEVPNQDYLYKKEIEPHILFFNNKSLMSSLSEHGQVMSLESFGKDITLLKANMGHRRQNKLISWLKAIVKALLVKLDSKYSEKLINLHQMNRVGDNQLWLRALIKNQK